MTRRLLAVLLWLLVAAGTAPDAHAASTQAEGITIVLRPGLSQPEIDAIMDRAAASGRPVTVRWEDAPQAGSAAVRPTIAAPASLSQSLLPAFRNGLAFRLEGLAHAGSLPGIIATAWASREAHGGMVLAAIALALLAGWAVHRGLLRMVCPARPAGGLDLLHRFQIAWRHLAADVGGVVALVLAGMLAQRLFLPAGDIARDLAGVVVRVLATVGLYAALGRALLAPGEPERRLLGMPHAEWHYRMLLIYAVIGALVTVSVAMAGRSGAPAMVVEGWFLLGATILTMQKLWWFWRGRADIVALFAGEAPVGIVRRVASQLAPWLLMVVALLIWAVGNIAVAPPEGGEHWGSAAGATQVIVILLPIAAMGVNALGASVSARRAAAGGMTPLAVAVAAMLRVLAAGAVWVLGAYVIAHMWNIFLLAEGIPGAAGSAVRISAILVIGLAFWAFLRSYFQAHAVKGQGMPGSDEEQGPLVQSRLATVLPIVRDLALGATIAITSLIVLSAMGFDIGPLLAGFGVVGLAISFGSQALVRDIVSGIFFMADDAFRVGEYVDTGKLKGTVEKITLRSVQLRHQNGPVHTIPFGQLQSITNASRDWTTIKFTIRLDRAADIEKARKLVKRVGQQLIEDAEFGPEFIQPLKMQGVQEIADIAIVVRCKFTCRPGKASWLQRECLKRIYQALNGAGVSFASNQVTVRGDGEHAQQAGAGALAGQPVVPAEQPTAS